MGKRCEQVAINSRKKPTKSVPCCAPIRVPTIVPAKHQFLCRGVSHSNNNHSVQLSYCHSANHSAQMSACHSATASIAGAAPVPTTIACIQLCQPQCLLRVPAPIFLIIQKKMENEDALKCNLKLMGNRYLYTPL